MYDYGKPVSIKSFYYLAGVDATPKDDFGRSFPGEGFLERGSLCWVGGWTHARTH